MHQTKNKIRKSKKMCQPCHNPNKKYKQLKFIVSDIFIKCRRLNLIFHVGPRVKREIVFKCLKPIMTKSAASKQDVAMCSITSL